MEYGLAREQLEKLANSAPSDIDFMLSFVLGVSRSSLPATKEITLAQFNKAKKYAKKLGKGVPLSQVIDFVPFCEAKIYVNRKVLSPRAETEELADMAIRDIIDKFSPEQRASVKVLDLCCGSGAIAVAVKKQTGAFVTATDISKAAVKMTLKNAKANKAVIKVIKSNMLKKVWGQFNYIICNPPYIAYGDNRVEQSVKKYEPHLALYAGENGLAYYTYLAANVGAYMLAGSKLMLEVGDGQAQSVADKFKKFVNVQILNDIFGKQRFVVVTK